MTILDAMLKLGSDATERGMLEAAIVYGRSVLRYGPDLIEEEIAQIVRALKSSDGNNR